MNTSDQPQLPSANEKLGQYFRQKRPEMLTLIPENARRILDIGCGTGAFAKQLCGSDREVWGAELSAEAAEEAKLVLDHVLCGDINTLLPLLPKQYFDCIVFNDVLEHLIDPQRVLALARSLLCENGAIIASIPNVRYYFHLRELLVDRQWQYRDYGILDRTHLRFFTKYSINTIFNEAGYTVIDIQGINPCKSWKFSLLNWLLRGHTEDMRYLQFACVARPIPTEMPKSND